MPRKPFQIQAFHGGINSKSDKRDISDTQVAEAIDISIDDIGSGSVSEVIVDNSGSGYSVKDKLFFDLKGFSFRRVVDLHSSEII